MIKVMNYVLMEFSKQSTHQWDIKMQMKAKIARRIEKLKQQHLVLSRRPKNEESFSEVESWVKMVENEVVPSLKSLRRKMYVEWMTFSSSQFHPISDINLTAPQIEKDLHHVMPVFTAEIQKRKQPPHRKTSHGAWWDSKAELPKSPQPLQRCVSEGPIIFRIRCRLRTVGS
jgi:hypothetical protein